MYVLGVRNASCICRVSALANQNILFTNLWAGKLWCFSHLPGPSLSSQKACCQFSIAVNWRSRIKVVLNCQVNLTCRPGNGRHTLGLLGIYAERIPCYNGNRRKTDVKIVATSHALHRQLTKKCRFFAQPFQDSPSTPSFVISDISIVWIGNPCYSSKCATERQLTNLICFFQSIHLEHRGIKDYLLQQQKCPGDKCQRCENFQQHIFIIMILDHDDN